MRIALLALLLCTLIGSAPAEGLEGKVMCGYQGWFRVPADGSNNGWFHYSPGKTFEPGSCNIDLWPDVRELPASERFPTGFKFADGSTAEVYSAVRPAVINLHFKWMKDYGIDGIFLQRFATTTRDERFRKPMDAVMEGCRNAAKEYGRSWVLMYDMSGLKPGSADVVIADWKRVNEQSKLDSKEANPNYLRHRGKPLVALWGIGFSDRVPMLEDWRKMIDFFKKDATPGGCSLMLGAPTYWRTLNRDAITDPALLTLLADADVLSPWMVGRYNSPAGAASHVTKTMVPDIAWCHEHKIDYLPVAFPGFSWHNMMEGRGKAQPVNATPRLGGKFLWSQFYEAHKAGAKMHYVAMFDEMDEGTAIFKVRQDPPVGQNLFVSEPDVPGDQYLWLTGQAGRMARGELVPQSDAMPAR